MTGKRFRNVLIIALSLSLSIVLTALYFRQEPKRTAQDAYLPMRSLTPLEVAVLLVNEESRDDDESVPRSIVESVNDSTASILTTVYVIEQPDSQDDVPEQSGDVRFQGKTFHLISNSWECYCARYKVNKSEVEKIYGKPVIETKPDNINTVCLQADKVSFSSTLIPFYASVEVLVLTALFVSLFYLFAGLNFLLWLPGVVALQVALSSGLPLYSPAFYDADWFYQRIIVEDLVIHGFFLLYFLGPMLLYLTALSLAVYLARLIGKAISRRRPSALKRYIYVIIGVVAISIALFSLTQYRNYRQELTRANAMANAVRSKLTVNRIMSIQEDETLQSSYDHVNFFKDEEVKPKTMPLIEEILSARSEDDPDLRVLVPVRNRYLLMTLNSHYTYADLRKLKGENGSHIIDYEYIDPAIRNKESYRTTFMKYLFNMIQRQRPKFIAIDVVLSDQDEVSSVVIATPAFER